MTEYVIYIYINNNFVKQDTMRRYYYVGITRVRRQTCFISTKPTS